MTKLETRQSNNKLLSKTVKLKKKKPTSHLTTPLSRIKKHLSVLKSIVLEFCSTTTFHGIRYITEEHRHWIERFLWTAISAMGVASAVVLINTVWAKYSTSPTITSVESTHYPIWNIPFPAVTICNINKVHLSLAVEIYQKLFSKILEEREYWAFISQMAEIIQPEEVDMKAMNIEHLRTALKLRNHTIGTLMVLLTQPCSSLMVKCRWRGLVVPCSDLFTLQRTDSGYCCSFNYFPIGSDKKHRPRHVNGAGYLAGLSVLLDPQLEDYYAALFSFYGVQVLVHSPREYPEVSARGNIIAPKKEVFLQVSGASTYSTPEVRALSLDQRMCLFEDEHMLDMDPTPDGSKKYQGEYSYSNCLVQCRMRHMMKLCNCTPYFYTMKTITKGLCRLAEVPCLVKYRRVFNNLRPPDPVPGLEDNEDAMKCDCQPTCSEVSYTTEQSEANFFSSSYDTTNFFKGVNITNHSIVHVYFKDLSVLRFRRDVIYTWNDLLASFGGIVGLCLGSSLISFVELFYYFTVRPACELLRNCEDHHHQQRQQRQQQQQQQQKQQQQRQYKQHNGQVLRSIKIMPAAPNKISQCGPPFDWIL